MSRTHIFPDDVEALLHEVAHVAGAFREYEAHKPGIGKLACLEVLFNHARLMCERLAEYQEAEIEREVSTYMAGVHRELRRKLAAQRRRLAGEPREARS